MYVKWIRGFVAALPLLLAAGSPGRAQDKPARPAVPDDVVFEPDIEYANPDGQHLKLDMARPKTGQGPFPAGAARLGPSRAVPELPRDVAG